MLRRPMPLTPAFRFERGTSERDTSKTCSACGRSDKRQRVERGLYVCECGFVGNAHGNGAKNIRRKVLPYLIFD